jgi:hypothetical protein
MPGFAVDDLPLRLVKAYSSAIYALAFAREGKLRLTRLDLFRSFPDIRRDSAEGESQLLIPGQVPAVTVSLQTGQITDSGTQPGHFNYKSSFTNPTYVFCTSDARISPAYLATRFGAHVVEITDPVLFSHALLEALTSFVFPDERELLFLDGSPVRYDKGSVGAHPASHSERLRLDFTQKPAIFAEEREYRFAAALSCPGANAPDFLDVTVTGCADWARLHAPPSTSAA